MADSFGTIPFTVLEAGLGRTQAADISITHIPGGAVTYIDYGGQTALRLDYALLLSAANYSLLCGTVGGTAQLVSCVDGTITSAVLMSVARSAHLPGGTTYANAVFTVVVP